MPNYHISPTIFLCVYRCTVIQSEIGVLFVNLQVIHKDTEAAKVVVGTGAKEDLVATAAMVVR